MDRQRINLRLTTFKDVVVVVAGCLVVGLTVRAVTLHHAARPQAGLWCGREGGGGCIGVVRKRDGV